MNLVNELQVSVEVDDVLTVLRKTKRLASKLGRRDISDWLRAEIDGYTGGTEVPAYRMVGATPAMNTNGYVPAGYGFVKNGVEELSGLAMNLTFPIRDPISTIVTWVESIGKGRSVHQPVDRAMELDAYLRAMVNPMFRNQVSFTLRMNDSQIRAVPEAIKDKVLDFACSLEEAGVRGDGQSFSEREQQIGTAVTFNITGSHVEQLNNLGSNQKGKVMAQFNIHNSNIDQLSCNGDNLKVIYSSDRAQQKAQVFVDDIESFSKVRQVSASLIEQFLRNGCLDIGEDVIQCALERILQIPVHKNDWGGEANDLYSANIVLDGERRPTAFLLKGNGLKNRTMEIKHCGKNGDQVIRLFQSPANLFVIQFVGSISESVIRHALGEVGRLRAEGHSASFLAIDGQDTARLLHAYGALAPVAQFPSVAIHKNKANPTKRKTRRSSF